MTDLMVYPTTLFKCIRRERTCCHRGVVSSIMRPVNHVFGLHDSIKFNVRILALNLMLGMNSDCFRVVTS